MKMQVRIVSAAVAAGAFLCPMSLGGVQEGVVVGVIAMQQDAKPDAVDAKVQQLVEAMYGWWETNFGGDNTDESAVEAKWKKFAEEQVAKLDINTLKAEHIEELMPLLSAADSIKDKIAKRIDELASSKTAEGARAAIMRVNSVLMQYMEQMDTQEAKEKIREAVRSALRHPGLGEAMKEGAAAQIFQGLAYFDREIIEPLKEDVVGLAKYLGDLPPEGLPSAMEYLSALESLGVSKEQRDAVRSQLVTLLATAVAKAKESDPRLAKYLESSAKYLNGAAAKGELLDHPAPQVTFAWYSGDTKVQSLNDLKGKVVVLDFWATWCGPCVGSFPQVRELQRHYEGYDVVIVGVTSIQGMHIDPEKGRVDCTGDPAQEMELMKGFMKQKDMTWPVAFSEQEVFNPDFGVRGIPHVAIIDAKGVVRYNGLHPGDQLAEKTKKIDALLKEAGLPVPVSKG